MMRSLGSAGLTLLTLGAGLGLYFVSYSVAQERGQIERYERQIASDRQEMRALQAELRVRSNLPQLERWNVEALALKAPKSGQILESEVQLASLVEPGTPAVGGNIQLASVELPRVKTPTVEAAETHKAPAPSPKPAGLFTAEFVADLDAAAATERAGLTKVALR